jgi:type IV pilus assembly protein PilB
MTSYISTTLFYMSINNEQLKAFLLDAGMVSRADFERAEKEAGKTKGTDVGKVLVTAGKISEADLQKVTAYVMGIPFVSLVGQKIDFETLSIIPEPVARNHNIIAFRQNKDGLEVAMLDTNDLSAIDFIKKKVGTKVLPRLTDSVSMREVLVQYQKSLNAEFGDLIQKDASALHITTQPKGDSDTPVSEKDLKKLAEDLPVIRIVDTLLKHAIIQNASDIHIEPLENQVLIRYRIDGILRDAMVLPKSAESSITARIKVLANLKLDEKRLPQDGRFRVDMEGNDVSFRVSLLPVHFGEKTVMRLLRDSVSGFSLEVLGFHGSALEALHDAIKKTTGMILTTGPTGSGKTTSLYTLLDILNTPDVNISTIEDPIEYQMARINQTQVRPDIGFTFSLGLRALVRQDPDIIMVGEIRDKETASLAVNAALTGHVVLSTLHTNSAAGALPRLVDMQIEPFLLVSTLNVVIGQRLVRKLTDSKTSYTLTDADHAQLKKHVDIDKVMGALREEGIIPKQQKIEEVTFYRPEPTGESETGYAGRMGIYEVMPVTASLKELVMQGASADKIEAQAGEEGMLTMIEDGLFKAAQGQTSIEEVLRVVSE